MVSDVISPSGLGYLGNKFTTTMPSSSDRIESDSLTQSESPASFAELDLSSEMMKALDRAGYESPSPVQAGVIPHALDEQDVLGQARTGTGKTAAFAIPILECVPLDGDRRPFALVLVPTRELAVQVLGEFNKLSHFLPINAVALYGGQPIRGQIAKLRNGAQILVGTPGRVLDHLSRGTFDARDLEVVVLDEADRMLDIGFRPDIEKILRRCDKDRQTLLLSATLPAPILRLAQRYMQDPVTLNFSDRDIAVETIDQYYFTVDANRKFELLKRLIQREDPTQAIVFCRTKRRTMWVELDLKKHFSDVGCMHGDMNQGQRNKVMARFREGKIKILVATDLVGRGIDISSISHIFNYDIPQYSDDYVHRVGRTGRMGRDGVAYTLVSPGEGEALTKIEMRIDKLLKPGVMEGFQLTTATEQKDGPEKTGPNPKPPPGGRAPKKYRRRL